MEFYNPIISQHTKKICKDFDGDSMLTGNALESRGWWKPGASKVGRRSLRSCFSERRWCGLGIDGVSAVIGNMYRRRNMQRSLYSVIGGAR